MPPLINALNDDDGGVRWSAVFTLGKLGDKRAIPALIQIIGDGSQNIEIKFEVVKALVHLSRSTHKQGDGGMSKTKYRVGIIGCGGIGTRYATAFQQLGDRVEVVAACDILEEKVNALVEQFEIPSAYTDMQQMLSKERLDIIGVTTHNREHVEPIIAAAEAGAKAILCEKPMALNMKDADRVIETCERSGNEASD